MIVTENGIDRRTLSPDLARVLGDGNGIVAEASASNCRSIEPAHFLAYLAKAGKTILRTEFLDPRGVTPQSFCENLYEVALDEDRAPGIPTAFNLGALSQDSRRMLDDFERIVADRGIEEANEARLLLVIFDHLPTLARRSLVAVAGTDEAYERFHGLLLRRATTVIEDDAVDIFESPSGRVLDAGFDQSGRRVLSLLREETASLGYRKATAMHLLYALIGIENGIVQHAIQYQAIDPVKEVHGWLSRELMRPGARRTVDFELTRNTLHDSVMRILEVAARDAKRNGVPIGELHIARAMVRLKTDMIADFLAGRKVDLALLQEYLGNAESEVEDTASSPRLPINEIQKELMKRILGQDHAIMQVLPWIKRLRFGFPRDRGPAAVFLFLGPSGTGKTQLAKELARTVYGTEDAIVMLEMGQFNTKESINIFIGAPPGYVGYGEGKLTNGLRDKPQSVILFDEIEKAHEDVWVALLRFLDEGLIGDPAGPTRDGRRCIVVLTSNLGADTLAQRLPPSVDAGMRTDPGLESAIREIVLPYLKRPEIYNRVDDKVVFRPLADEIYLKLVQQHADREARKFLDLHGITVEIRPDVLGWLAERASEARQEGARCVPRLVNKFVVAPAIDVLTENERRAIKKVVISRRADGNGTVAEAA